MASVRPRNAPPSSDKAVLPRMFIGPNCKASPARTYDLAEIPIAEDRRTDSRSFACAVYQLVRASIGQMSTSLSPATQW
jgi:hypothetical protein